MYLLNCMCSVRHPILCLMLEEMPIDFIPSQFVAPGSTPGHGNKEGPRVDSDGQLP